MNLFKSTLVILSIFVLCSIADRKLHAEFNPGCSNHSDNCTAVSKLVYIQAEGDNDTMHFIFDFTTTYKPSLVVVTTDKDTILEVNYTNVVQEGIIKFTKLPNYIFGSVFNNLYEFNDVNDTARMENNENIIKMDFKKFDWSMTQLQNHNNELIEVTVSANSYRAPMISKTGIVSIKLKVFGRKDKGSMYPHLVHTPESGEFTLTLDQLETNFTKSRFAVELLTISSFPFNKSEEISVNTFSDDKSSGGIFSNYLVVAKGDEKEGGGYLSWKPVVYKSANTHAFNSSSTVQYGIHNHLDEKDWIQTPLFKMYGNTLFKDNSQYLMKATNVSFGQPNDEFYVKSNYLYWTFLVGVGAPPNSNLGFLEITIIASLLLMLTITMILIFCILMRWVSSKRNSIIYGQ